MAEKEIKSSSLIDVEAVLKDKNPALAKLMPGFIIRYLKHIVRQDEINAVISGSEGLQGLEYVNSCLKLMGVKSLAKGLENVPSQGRFVFASNHPLGGLDGLVFAKEVGKMFPNLRFLVNDILMNLKGVENIFIPVNKHGKQSTEYARKIEQAYSLENTQILNFPAGLCSRKVKGSIVDLQWQKNFIMKARKHERDIIPVYIEGRNSNFFYNLANLRKFLGIGANIEMIYLVDEMLKQKNKTITIHFGKPISHLLLDNSKKPIEWASYVKERVYEISQKPK